MRNATDILKMTLDDLLSLRSKIDRRLDEIRMELQNQLSRLTTIARVSNSARPQPAISPAKGTKVKPKFRGPAGETWAGRGLAPNWLVGLVKQGHKKEEYAIGIRAASRNKTRLKKARSKGKPSRKAA